MKETQIHIWKSNDRSSIEGWVIKKNKKDEFFDIYSVLHDKNDADVKAFVFDLASRGSIFHIDAIKYLASMNENTGKGGISLVLPIKGDYLQKDEMEASLVTLFAALSSIEDIAVFSGGKIDKELEESYIQIVEFFCKRFEKLEFTLDMDNFVDEDEDEDEGEYEDDRDINEMELDEEVDSVIETLKSIKLDIRDEIENMRCDIDQQCKKIKQNAQQAFLAMLKKVDSIIEREENTKHRDPFEEW